MKLIKVEEQYIREISKQSDLVHFAKKLGSPCYFKLSGREDGKPIVISTLLHGNEPSGLQAIKKLCASDYVPRFDTFVIVASLAAALTEPAFTYRMLPGQKDLNRCFSYPQDSPVSCLQVGLANAIKSLIHSLSPLLVIDIHNTSGSGPAFAVAIKKSSQALSISGFFCSRIIITDIRLGSLMEQDFSSPVVTIEAGGSLDAEADNTAFNGLRQLLDNSQPLQAEKPIEILKHPRRLEINDNIDIHYALEADGNKALVIRADLEQYNFGETPKNTLIAWSKLPMCDIFALDMSTMSIKDFFIQKGSAIYTRFPMRLFMITSRADIAKSDCLFYFVCDKD